MTYPDPNPPVDPADPRYQGPSDEVVEESVEDSRARRIRTIRMVNTVIRFICGLFAIVLVAHIILVLAEANPDNAVAAFVSDFSGAISLGFRGLFTPDSEKAQTLLNDGAAAIVWLLIAAALTYLIRRFAMPSDNREIRYRRSVR